MPVPETQPDPPGDHDWTNSPAKWGAVAALAAAGIAAIGWSILTGRTPIPLGQPRPAATSIVSGHPFSTLEPAPPPLDGWAGAFVSDPPHDKPVTASPHGPLPEAVEAPGQLDASNHDGGAGPFRLIDLNAATEAELQLLPGVGPTRARAIADDRRRHGPFASVDDLDRVPGIGPATIEAIRPFARVGRP